MPHAGPSMEQRARSEMFYKMASISAVFLGIAGTALGILGKPQGWFLVAFSFILWFGLFLTLKYTKKIATLSPDLLASALGSGLELAHPL